MAATLHRKRPLTGNQPSWIRKNISITPESVDDAAWLQKKLRIRHFSVLLVRLLLEKRQQLQAKRKPAKGA